jgi:uncharacterized protein YaaR (DUF327 family)
MEPIRSEPKRGIDRRPRSRNRDSLPTGDAFSAHLEKSPPTDDIVNTEGGITDPSLMDDLPPVGAPVQRLYDAVHEAGQRLLHQRTYTAAQHYRESIRRFLRSVLPDANGITVQESHRDILSRKRYYLLTEINRSVDRLISGLLQTQVEQLDILNRLEEIEGLLVDLMQ